MRPSLRRQNRTARGLEEAAAKEAAGDFLGAIDTLVEENRRKRNAEIEARLVNVRNRAFEQLGDPQSHYPEPEQMQPGSAAEDDGLPSLAAGEVTPARIRGALLSHGALIVRGLVDRRRAGELRNGIDRSFAARDDESEAAESGFNPWYEPFRPEARYEAAVKVGRRFVGKGSGIWTADSPRVQFELLDSFDSIGLRESIHDYLGERPALSVNKGTLRRAQPTVGTEWWHQDGAFLGRDIRSLNVWLALSDCGVDAPGLEVVPRRLEEIVECGTEGADFDWSVGDPVVERVSGGTLAWPTFAAGDALFFDHLFLHRTGSKPTMTKTRYAIETWFFAPSAYPDPQEQVPIAY